jgi:hypothetical protein
LLIFQRENSLRNLVYLDKGKILIWIKKGRLEAGIEFNWFRIESKEIYFLVQYVP